MLKSSPFGGAGERSEPERVFVLQKKTDGILPAILNTLYVIVLTLLIVLPLGVGAAVYLCLLYTSCCCG